MSRLVKIAVIIIMALLPVQIVRAQPVWVKGTPTVASTGPLSITMNYGLDQIGTVYIIVYNFNNTSILSSSTVRTRALAGPSGTLVATAVIPVRRADIGLILQTVLNVINPNQIHTIYIVAADSKGSLQAAPIRLNATTLPCPQADAGSGGDECDLNFVLNAVPQIGTGIWTKISGPGNASFSPNANAPNATVTVTQYGSYTLRWTESLGVCKSSDDIVVNFITPPVADGGSGGNQCDLDFLLSAVVGSSDIDGTWSMKSGTGTATFSPDEYSPTATVTVSEYGAKVFTWTVRSGPCFASSDVAVNFYQQPVANPGIGGNNCGREFYFNAIPSVGTGTWTRVSGPGTATYSPNNHSPTARVTVSAYGTYVFRWTEVNGSCSSRATITVGFFEQVSADAGNGGEECDRNFLLNAVPGTGTGTWSKITGPGEATFTPNANQYNAVVSVSQWGDYDFAWTLVNNNCSSTDIIRVSFHAPPSIDAGTDKSICKGSGIKLQATGTGTFLWTPSSFLDNPQIPDPVATPPVSTVYTVTLTDQWNCKNSDQISIEVLEKPVVDAGPNQILNYLFETQLAATDLKIHETGEWLVLSGNGEFTNKNSNNTYVKELLLGDNRFLWSVTNGVCAMSSDTVFIRINDLVIPTLITPNNDGINDTFIIKGLESLGRTEFVVFNRWGYEIYRNSDYANEWDGVDQNGNPLPEDTYFYSLKAEKLDPIKGYIVIRR